MRQAQVVAALDGLYRALRALSQPHESTPTDTCAFREVCIPCKKFFQSRVAWSCHSQKVHGYRTPAYLLGSKALKPLCASCGKLFASRGRLQRHLAYSPDCIRQWGSFSTVGDCPCEAHPQAPPELLPGVTRTGEAIEYDPDISAPLLRQLSALDSLEDDVVWEVIASHIEPLAVLRATVQRWALLSPLQAVGETAHNMLLLLDPDLLGETVVQPRQTHAAR